MRLYDSSVSCKLSSSLKKQLKQIYQAAVENGHLKVTEMPVQQQLNATDCGIFSIAFAYHLAIGDELSNLDFSDEDMRQHLLECFNSEELRFFPLKSFGVHCSKKHRTIRCV